MEKLKQFWESKSEGEKRKYIVYSIAGVVILLLIVGVFSFAGNDKEENKVSDFSNPDAKEVKKYNSRADANDMGKKDSTDVNLAMNDLFDTKDQPQQVQPIEEPTYNNYVEPNYNQPNYSTAPKKSTGGGGGSYSSHATYGDYDMWQANEPKNNSIGYTEVKNYPKGSKNKSPQQAPADDNLEQTFVQPSYSSPSPQGQVNLKNAQQIKAKLLSQGYATNGRSLSFVLLENAVISGVPTKKGQIVTGVAQEQNNRLLVGFTSVKVNNKIVPATIQLYGSDGMAGIPIGGSNQQNNNNIQDQAINQTTSRIPVVGGIINSFGSNRTPDNRIKLSNNIECIIVIN